MDDQQARLRRRTLTRRWLHMGWNAVLTVLMVWLVARQVDRMSGVEAVAILALLVMALFVGAFLLVSAMLDYLSER